MPGRLLIVSNRLPVSVNAVGGDLSLAPASGGLATGLGPWHERSGGLWLGWPGDVSRLTAAGRAELDRRLAGLGIVPVHLPRDQVDRYYHGFANRVLWPLLHYLVDRVPVAAAGWDAYQQVNEIFAEAVARQYRPGDTIWVHDYQLMLVPALLRQRLPEARIGFFLHIPFPSSDVFRVLPWRREILTGLLGADLVGFHTFGYLRHFLSSVRLLDGVEVDIDRVRVGSRRVSLGAFPMGVDAGAFGALAADPAVEAEAARIRADAGGRRIVLGVDRLDYTKGIPRRLQAIERLLEQTPALRDGLRFVQVAVPSRGEVDSYQRFRREVEETVGRINGTCGTVRSAPIHYMHQSVTPQELVALYRAADVMLVTPLRDGMNLVAKEFVASRVDGDGVLMLSEFAGAAAELDGSVLTNPYDVDAVAATLRDALALPEGERRARMTRLRRRVADHDVHAWAAAFLDALATAGRRAEAAPTPAARDAAFAAALADARRQPRRRLLLDYDGTLVPLRQSPEQAAPDEELRDLLRALAATPGTEIAIVSGRPHQTLDAWFGDVPVALWAEHGLWHRPAPGAGWQPVTSASTAWVRRIHPILEQFTSATPGARLELKTASIAWHYRQARPEFGLRQAHDLHALLVEALSNQPLEVLEGDKVIEVRPRGVSKAAVAARLGADLPAEAVIAIGDDRTDEDLFRVLPASSVTIAVGRRPSAARFRVEDYRAVRRFLRSLIDGGRLAALAPLALMA
jgi:trehalose 6-phosphate synthase/phosphatase